MTSPRDRALLYLSAARNGEGRYADMRGYRAALTAVQTCADHVASLVRLNDCERARVEAEAHDLLTHVYLAALRAKVTR